MENNMLQIKQLSFHYPKLDSIDSPSVSAQTEQLSPCPVLDGISLTIQRGAFSVLCGPTGSGKSTLLRLIKQELAPFGEKQGEILFHGQNIETLAPKRAAAGIGFVGQSPEQQLVTDRVWHELAFGLENLGFPQKVIQRRVQEIANYFGISEWFEKPVYELSGGQKQLLNLAAVMVMQPELLLLDEPTAQLDPIAASEYIRTLQKLNEELGLTLLISEHRLEELIPIGSQLILLDQGRILIDDVPRAAAKKAAEYSVFRQMMPTAVRLYYFLQEKNETKKPEADSWKEMNRTLLHQRECPLTVKEGRAFLEAMLSQDSKQRASLTGRGRSDSRHREQEKKNTALQIKNGKFRYGKNGSYVLNDLNMDVIEEEILCILGANGSGKSTMLGVIAGWNKLESGEVRIFGKKSKDYKNQSLYRNCLALLPQEVQTLFLYPTVKEELQEAFGASEGKSLQEMITEQYGALFSALYPRMNKHPYDCSGGEQQLLALAKVMAGNPRLLLMDEPTKGLDADTKKELQETIFALKRQGVTLVIVTHDIEFAAVCADRCALFFCGEINVIENTRDFFAGNYFYTTVTNRMAREVYPGVVTLEELLEIQGEEKSLCL